MSYEEWRSERHKQAIRDARRRMRGHRWGDPLGWFLAGVALTLVLAMIQILGAGVQ